ncbi:Fic family protein [Anoxybacillus voinovskiensis]|uniref:Fic family protein n=1 Tax=Anoxybacteroides voinovskiense TaxID=230470 RepID=A0A840DTZ6_9BACL|nr:Fic family protein [Anoxybacillus voinovskiensis]MBB4075045.1 Fic family protein [Anoxybacillus voinovskiensis]GGJ76441.1 hypothetical protein GCM10008982_27140 [Anoxybacillus voinovskiensis]
MYMYELLSKLYYKAPERYFAEWEKRVNSYGTVHLPLSIKPYKSNDEFSCFYVNHQQLDVLHEQLTKQSKQIQTIVHRLPPIAIQQYIQTKLIDELLSTNEIEGIRSTRREMETVIEIIVRKETAKKRNVRHLSLMNAYFHLLSGDVPALETVKDIRTIYDRLVREEIKPGDALDGELFRKQAVDVVTATGKIIHRGVYPEKAIQTKLQQLIRFLREHPSPMLYKIAISHYYFGYIHPFYDGNGRTARYISSMYLMQELDFLTALTLSYATNQRKQLYYDAFSEANHPHNRGELTFFCEVFFHIIDRAQHEVLEDLAEKEKKMTKLYALMEKLKMEDETKKNIVFFLGQSDIFGIAGKGLTKKELLSLTGKTEYLVRKALDELHQAGWISFRKRKPMEITLSETLASQY